MDHTCPSCGTVVATGARACPSCGLARNVPVFGSDGSFVGSGFSAVGGAASPPAVAASAAAAPARPPGRLIAVVAGIFVGAVVLGVVVALGIRAAGGGPFGGVATPTPTVAPVLPPVSPDPIETPDAVTGPFTEAARRTSSGTYRILASTCTGTGIGTAFGFGPEGMLVTSARTVSGARAIAVLSGDRIVPATVAKIDTRSGLALLKPGSAPGGYTFDLGTRQLAVGDEVAALGWTSEAQQPARGRARTTVGTISEAGVRVESVIGQHTVRKMTGEFDPGMAGAPVVDRDGRVLGMLLQAADDQGELLVAGLDTIADPLLGPTGMPPAMEPCLTAAGPRSVTTVGGSAPTATRTALGQWFGALNAADWDRARGALAGGLREEMTRAKLEADYRGSYAFNIVTAPGDGGVLVSWIKLSDDGERCARHVAHVRLDQDGIGAMTPEGAPVPCG